MKKFIILPLLLVTLFSNGQTVDEIVANYSKAMGGLENYKNVKTVIMQGKIEQGGMSFPITVRIITGRAVRTDIEIQGKMVTESYKDGKGWTLNQLQGSNEPTAATPEQLIARKRQTQISGNLMNYIALGNKVVLDGKEKVEGVETYKLKLTYADNGSEIYYFIDADSWMIIKTCEKRNLGTGDTEIDVFFSDIKNVNGIKFPFAQHQKIGDQLFLEAIFSSIEINKEVDEKIFDQ